jgi:hypothetical protein
MEIEYTDHAEENLDDREIKKEEVESAINNPDEIIDGGKKRKIIHKAKNGKLLRVICEGDKKAYKVVTAFYSKKERYMQK